LSLGRRVVVTGLGAVSALGATAAANWEAARHGVCGIRNHLFEPGPLGPGPFELPAAMVAPGYTAALEARLGRKTSAFLDPFALMMLAAAFEALDHAGLVGSEVLDRRCAVVTGHGMGGLETLETGYERFYGKKTSRMHPAMVPKVMVSAAPSAVAMQFGIHGPVFATSSACASSAHAIMQGAMLIASGLVDVAVVGGSEAIATPGCMCGWVAIQALSAGPCHPFSKDRDGMTMGEGGAALVLEAMDHAEARGARPLGEYLGGGMTSDASHITQPTLEGPSEAIRQAVMTAVLLDDHEVLISTHGTGTLLNDQNEAAALRAVFGAALDHHPVIATKSAHGHLIGGSAALQAVIALQALSAGLAPPILNYLGPDPACDLNLVLGKARPISADRLLLNAFAFGGLNVALAFGRWR
jgi:nodulation protein E